jgi:GAF domain-containing protein
MEEMELASLMAKVATDMRDEASHELTVRTIATHAAEVVPDTESASVTVQRRHQTFETVSATDDLALRADELQYRLGEGPCVEALMKADWFRSGDAHGDPRWPAWGPAAGELGVGSVLSVNMLAGSQPIGTLNLYSTRRGGFADPDEVDLALLYARHAAHALESARLVDGLQAAVSSRHTIGIAQGILIERYGLTVDQSFNFLRRVSSHTNTKVTAIASQIVETGEVPPAELGGTSSRGAGGRRRS